MGKIKTIPTLRKTVIKEAIEKRDNFIEYEENLPINLIKGSLIDFEATNVNIDYAQLITVGIIHKDKIKIIQLLDDSDKEQFITKIKEEIKKLEGPFFAYMADYEKGILEKLGINIKEWKELSQPVPFLDDDGKWQDFNEVKLKKEYHIHIPGINFGDGRLIPFSWKHYNLTNDVWDKANIIYDIIRHNRQCLIKELCILITGEEET